MFYKAALAGGRSQLSERVRHFSRNNVLNANHRCKLLVVGGGTGGCSVSAKFARSFKKHETIIVEPADTHYYQSMFTMIGGGIKELHQAGRPMAHVLPKNATWLKDSVQKFNPKMNTITTKNGDEIEYEFMLIAVGLELHYNKIPGLLEALSTDGSGVCSNYSPRYVEKTYKCLQEFESGNMIFTYPDSPVKCPGAPQKICYISEHYLRKVGKRHDAKIYYNTALPKIFGVQKYADALTKICKKRHINVNLRTNLIEVKPDQKLAVFQNLDRIGEKTTIQYSMLHVTPPMGTPTVLKECKELVNEDGFVEVDKSTLQSTHFDNVFAIGDCSNSPNSKTAAAVATQSDIVHKNIRSRMAGRDVSQTYNGYASCPLVTGYGTCILAEFDYDLKPVETFPFDQSKESFIMYCMKKEFMPQLYWHLMLKGRWNGPGLMRSIMHLGMK